MTNEDTTTRQKKLRVEPTGAERQTVGPSPLLEQAQAWTDVARQAHDECVKGDKAEKELKSRRNESGQ